MGRCRLTNRLLCTHPRITCSRETQPRRPAVRDPLAFVTQLSPKTHRVTRLARTLLVVVAGGLVALSLSGPAAAATPCGKKVLNDWWDNGRVDRLYPLHCYEEAIDGIPKDIRDYSDAEQVISRALQAAVGGNLATGGNDPSPDDDPGIRDPGAPVPGGSGPPGDGGSVASPEVGEGTSSVPIPLIVLGGMSLALLAAGGLGYLSRRRQARAEGGGDENGPLDPLA
jgi:hypothetical protein